MPQQLDAILQQIEQLDADERLLVEQKLRDLAEAEWRAEAELARTTARQRVIDQQTIDDAIEDLRYGS